MNRYRLTCVQHNALLLSIVLGLLATTLMLSGCKTEVKGGSTLDDKRQLAITGGQERVDLGLASIDLRPDGGVTVSYHRDKSASTQPSSESSSTLAASTQPSVSTTGSATPRVKSDDDGDWSLSFDQIKAPPRAQWPLFAIFAVAAFLAFRFGGSIPVSLVCAGLALLSVVWPAMVGWLALASVALAAWSARKTILQLIRGNQESLKVAAVGLTNVAGDVALKSVWKGEHDETTKRVVKAMRR